VPLDEEEDIPYTTDFKIEKDETGIQPNTQRKEKAPRNPPQNQDLQITGIEISSNKRAHGSEGSELDKESPITITENKLSIITTSPNSGGW